LNAAYNKNGGIISLSSKPDTSANEHEKTGEENRTTASLIR
jgi:hypothetical protein